MSDQGPPIPIPYGIADFYALRTSGYLYVDRTDRIPVIEAIGRSLLFLRPRRFGKSLWLRTLSCYYDLRYADEHERLFGDLAAGRDPTPLAHNYFVLELDFSDIDPDPPPRGVNAGVTSRVERLANEIHNYLNSSIKGFLSDNREHLPCPVDIDADAFRTLDNLLAAIRQTPHPIYFLVDEYDNFANEVMTADPDTYHKLVHVDGPFKRLFKWVKTALKGQGLERLFITGVSPLVMSDVTSGLNVVRSVSLDPRLCDLCGFSDSEINDLLARVLTDRGESSVSFAQAKAMMREWYNGYRFAPEAKERIYNPTLTLYFLQHLQDFGRYPRQMLDSNLAADEGKLSGLSKAAAGQEAVLRLIRTGKPLEIGRIEDSFTLRAMLEGSAQDASFLGSFLFYFGVLTIAGETDVRTLLLSPPNEVIRKLYVDCIRRLLMPLGAARSAADETVFAFFASCEIESLLDFIETTLFPTFSNRDATWANELTVKTVFLTLLWNEISYITHSEPELDHGYADLCLLRRPDARASRLSDLLFEFKRLPLGDLGKSGKEVRAASREELENLEPVQKALDQAEEQLRRYVTALERRYGSVLKLRAWAVLALGFERIIARPL